MSDSPAHLVKRYEQELRRLHALLIEMGGIVEHQVSGAIEAISRGAAASGVIEADLRVDALEREAEQFVVRLLALRQPVASDLRMIVAALKITTDLERIGDYAANVAKRSVVLAEFALPHSLTGLLHMGRSGGGHG